MPAIGIPSVIDLGGLDPASGISFTGTREVDYSGVTITAAGDVNGDSYDDALLGIFWGLETETFAAEAYIVYGGAASLGSIDLAALTPATGVTITGLASIGVGAQWLVGGDNLADAGNTSLLIGAAPDFGAYLLYGSAGLPGTIDVGALSAPDGKLVSGFPDNGDTGLRTVGLAGDLNGDGRADLLFGSPTEEPSRAYVVFAPADALSPVLDVSALDGNNGFVIEGIGAADATGWSIESAGDVNGDGRPDIILGAFAAAPGGRTDAGAAYVIFAHDGPWDANLDLADLDGSNGFSVVGLAPGDKLGVAVSSAGDINGDGFADIVIGAPGADGGRGAAYVVFGRSTGFDATIDLASLDGSNGFRIDGAAPGEGLGFDVTPIGDFDGDGIDDIAVGTRNTAGEGSVYVVMGQSRFYVPSLQLSDLDGLDRDNGIGFRIDGAAGSGPIGMQVNAAGDFNGDGFADIALSTAGRGEAGPDYGAAYILYGRLPATSVLRYGTDIGQTIHGSGGLDTLHGLGGDDVLIGLNGSDYLFGGDGNDTLEGGNGADRLFGSAGDDLLRGGTGDDTLQGGDGQNRLEGGAGNDTYLIGYGTDLVIDTAGDFDTLISYRSFSLDEFADSGIEFFLLDRAKRRGGTITGTDGDDHIAGRGSRVIIDGGAGNDRLGGTDGSSEVFIGGAGRDTMSSGFKNFDDPFGGQHSGRDRFVFRDVTDSAVGEDRDVIHYFLDGGGDWLDLRQIDANTARSGNQAFHLIDSDFTGTAGELRIEFVDGPDADTEYHLVSGDVNGDGAADFEIEVHTQWQDRTLTADDFFL